VADPIQPGQTSPSRPLHVVRQSSSLWCTSEVLGCLCWLGRPNTARCSHHQQPTRCSTPATPCCNLPVSHLQVHMHVDHCAATTATPPSLHRGQRERESGDEPGVHGVGAIDGSGRGSCSSRQRVRVVQAHRRPQVHHCHPISMHAGPQHQGQCGQGEGQACNTAR
jgi:hypothetical protein